MKASKCCSLIVEVYSAIRYHRERDRSSEAIDRNGVGDRAVGHFHHIRHSTTGFASGWMGARY
jgi:hypothetical protein